ncbi:hypothetical protein BpHYR1_036123 [Brachionus plicatilis]|uniref:Uncharacterized protein n=1 Tax=Brachionus plicatilis TaxID=10195 RepID=A0A3M7S5H0_BRAPC|nr:hypothetical protein BpHYR1_036123 [Brachionus plicatilis]
MIFNKDSDFQIKYQLYIQTMVKDSFLIEIRAACISAVTTILPIINIIYINECVSDVFTFFILINRQRNYYQSYSKIKYELKIIRLIYDE